MKTTLARLVAATALTGLIAGCSASASQSDATVAAPAKPLAERMFSRFDANSDGQITRDEVKAQAAERFARMDTDGDGIVTRDERREARKARQIRRTERRFARMDTDGNGAVSVDEMKAAMARRAERRFARLDTNADGGLSMDEMLADRGRDHRMGMRRHGHEADHSGRRHDKGYGKGHAKRGPMTQQDLDARVMRMFDQADVNGDGVVTLDEAKGLSRHGRRG